MRRAWLLLGLALLSVAALWLWRAGGPEHGHGVVPAPSSEAIDAAGGAGSAGDAVAHAEPEPAALEERRSVDEPDPQRTMPAEESLPEAATGQISGGLVVEARFADPDRPAPGEWVLVRRTTGARPERDDRAHLGDEHGRVELADLAPGYYWVRLLRGGQESVQVVAGRTARVELLVQPGPDVAGLVVDEHGFPIAGAEVLLSEAYRLGRSFVAARTDEAGRFRLRSLRSDQHYIGARASGRAPSHVELLVGPPGTTREVRFVLHPDAGTVRGRVVDVDREPVAGATVLVGDEEARPAQRDASGEHLFAAGPQRVTSDAAGAFALDTVQAGSVPVQAKAEGFAPLRTEVEVLVGVASEVTLVLRREARVEGVVTDEMGYDVERALVHTLVMGRLASSMAYSGRGGRYALDGLPTGRIRLVAEQRDFGRDEVELEVGPGETVEWNPVLSRSARIHGVVLDDRREPLAGWGVVVWEDIPSGGRARSDPTRQDGSFSISDVEDRDHVLMVHPPGGWADFPRATLRGLRPGPTPLEVVVEGAERTRGSLRGEVLEPGGNPAQGVPVHLWHVEERLWRSYATDEQGVFEVRAVPPGTCEVHVRPERYPWVQLGTRAIEAGALHDLGTLTLEPAGFLHGRILGADDERLAGLRLVLTLEGRDGEAGVLGRTDRRYRSSPLGPGTYRIHVSGDGLLSATHDISLAAGEELGHDLTLEPAGSRAVVLVLDQGRELPSWVSLMALEGEGGRLLWSGAATPSSHEVELRVSVPPGLHRLRAGSSDGREAQADFEVVGFDGRQAALRLALR